MAKRRIQYGPFRGYVSAAKRHLVTPRDLTTESYNVLVNPVSGEVECRGGSTIVGDTLSGGLEVSGLLGAHWSSRSRKAFALGGKSFSDGLQTHASLWTKDLNPASGTFPTVDEGYFGQVYVRNELASALKNYTLLSEFSSTTYPASNGTFNTEPVLKCVPLWYESGEGGYTRGASEFSRRFLAAGSRSVVQTDAELLFPNLRGTPIRWDKALNGSTTGSERVRIFPTGPFAPLWCPTFDAADKVAATGSDSLVKDGTTFFVSVLYEDQYGAFWMPCMPRIKNARLSGGMGFVTIGTAGGGSYYRSFTLRNIPIGPPGTRRRVVLACDPQVLAATSDKLTLRIAGSGDNPGLKILGTLENNTQTTMVVTNMDLLQNDNVVRFDHVLPRRARHLFTGDQRVIAQVTLPNPTALHLAPVGANTDYDLNAADDSATLYGTKSYYYRVTSLGVYLYQYDAGTLTEQTFDFATYATLQDLVDAINATTVAGTPNCKQWRAQLAPGVDGTMDSSTLCPTSRDVADFACTINQATISGSISSVPVGALISDANFPAGTYLVSKQSATTGTLSANATATAGAHTATFYSYCGDGASYGTGWAVAGPSSRYGLIRAHSGSFPGAIYFKRSALFGYDRVDTQSVYFTKAAPGDAVTGASLSPNGWVRANRRLPPPGSAGKSVGRGMGGIDISGGALVGYSDGIFFFVNERGGNTGEDFDVRLKTINLNSGVICDTSWAAGNGWGSYLKSTGLHAADVNLREMLLSQDIHNVSNGDGDLVGEINACLASLDGDTDDACFFSAVLGGQLHIAYRAVFDGRKYCDRRQVYDFSTALDSSRLEQLINPETRQAFGWSAPFLGQFGSCMCEVRRSGGLRRYFTQDTHSGSADGRMDRFDSGSDDNGGTITNNAQLATVLADPYEMISAERVEVVHTTPTGATVTLNHYFDVNRTESAPRTLTASADTFKRETFDLAEKSHTNAHLCELSWNTTGVISGVRLARVVLEYEPQVFLPQ